MTSAPDRFQALESTTPTHSTEPPSLDMAWYGIGFTDAVKRAFQKYATFSGRASRGEFFWWQLALFIPLFVGAVLYALGFPGSFLFPIITFIYLVAFIPTIAVDCRRLHDVGKSGWVLFWAIACGLILAFASIVLPTMTIASADYPSDVASTALALYFIPGIIDAILTIYIWVLYARPSDPTANEYGPGPARNQYNHTRSDWHWEGEEYTTSDTPMSLTEEIATLNNAYRISQAEERVIGELNTEIAKANEELAAVSMQINSIEQEESGAMRDKSVVEDLYNAQAGLASKVKELQDERAIRQELLDEKKEEHTRLTRITTNLPSRTAQHPTPPPPPAPAITSDPILAELEDPATPATRLHEIAALAVEHPEYRAALLFHPNTYPELTNWIRGL